MDTDEHGFCAAKESKRHEDSEKQKAESGGQFRHLAQPHHQPLSNPISRVLKNDFLDTFYAKPPMILVVVFKKAWLFQQPVREGGVGLSPDEAEREMKSKIRNRKLTRASLPRLLRRQRPASR